MYFWPLLVRWKQSKREKTKHSSAKQFIIATQFPLISTIAKQYSEKYFNVTHFSPASACVLDLFCRTQTNVPSAGQRNSLCSASSGQTWFSSLQKAGCRRNADTALTAMAHTEQRSQMRAAGWSRFWLSKAAMCEELW